MEQKGYRRLIVWQKADELAYEIYLATKTFPKEEVYGITSQLRRAALSVPTNLAEGFARQGKKEFKQFSNIALGSLTEVEYLLDFALKLEYLNKENHQRLTHIREEAGRLLWGFQKSLSRSLPISCFFSFAALLASCRLLLVTCCFFLVICCLSLVACRSAFANNLAVTNTTLASQDTSADTVTLQFDISWSNSWRDAVNYDAAWVFIKYSTDSGTTWNHATLKTSGTNPSGFSTGSGTGISIVVPTDKKGCFIQRSGAGTGSLSTTSVQVVWDYGLDSVSDTNAASMDTQFKIIGIEMVYIPTGGFWAGDGISGYAPLLQQASTQPAFVDSEAKIGFYSGVAGDWYYSAAGYSGEFTSGAVFEVGGNFPKGYHAFYMMKYEVTEGQWVNFFNMLTTAQKVTRDITSATGKNSDSTVNRNTVSCTGSPLTCTTTRADRAVSYIRWPDQCAYLDWSALRPFTELEFNKAARGPLQYNVNATVFDYAWGLQAGPTYCATISGSENGTETCSTASANVIGNNITFSGGDAGVGPVRVGMLATSSTTTRETSGGSYYGVMDLSGNLWERAVTLGTVYGITFAGTHGDGVLTTTTSYEGNATNLDWPGFDVYLGTYTRGVNSYYNGSANAAYGSGYYGGSYSMGSAYYFRTSNRSYAAYYVDTATADGGGRGVRTAPD